MSLSDNLRRVDDATLRENASRLRRASGAIATPPQRTAEAFALVREAARRFVGMAHYPTQLQAGRAAADGAIAEMQTGEGKTLAALLPAFVYGVAGRGCHMVTANDYLAERDAQLASRVLRPLGVSVGCITSGVARGGRRREYQRDVTYGTAREFGFDFLHDRLAAQSNPADRVQGRLRFAMIDEADNLLLDDAVSPLVIARPLPASRQDAELLAWCDETARGMREGADYELQAAGRSVRLTDQARLRVRKAVPPGPLTVESGELLRLFVDALTARVTLRRDHDYLVSESGQVTVIDASTGRVSDGRRWRDGLHQAVEVKEGLPPSASTETVASCTVQSYFRRYQRLAGMTGTARPATAEFRRVFQLSTRVIPTHRTSRRTEFPARVFVAERDKLAAVVEDLEGRQRAGGAVLVGAPSLAAAEGLAARLEAHGVSHQVLHCRAHRREAEIVGRAGQPGVVTIATNMAGRGTDIPVHPDVIARGGLHVIVTQLHRSERIDRQLVGRAARQGDPGSFQFFLSLEDEILASLPTNELANARRSAAGDGELASGWQRLFRRAQGRAESRDRRLRHAALVEEKATQKACRRMGVDPVLETER